MRTQDNKKQKKEWQKPAVRMLDIKKDTFAGSGAKTEQRPGQGPTNFKP